MTLSSRTSASELVSTSFRQKKYNQSSEGHTMPTISANVLEQSKQSWSVMLVSESWLGHQYDPSATVAQMKHDLSPTTISMTACAIDTTVLTMITSSHKPSLISYYMYN